MRKVISLFLAIVLGNITVATAQLNWNGKEEVGKPKWFNLNDLVDQKKYSEAVPDAVWLLQNTPNLTKGLYQQSAKIFQGAQKVEKDKARKIALQDSALWVWDKRIELYGDEAKCLNKKGKVAWKYLSKRKGENHTEELYSLYKKIYDLNGDKMYTKSATYYFRSGENMYFFKKIEKSEVLSLYGEMMAFLDRKEVAKADNAKEVASINKQRDKINADFDKNIPLDCDEVAAFYGEKYMANPNLEDAKKINGFLAKNKCFKSDLFIATNDFIPEKEPSAERFAFAAYIAQNDKDYPRAYEKFQKALELETSDSLKSKYYFSMAQIKFIEKDLVTSRKHARESIAAKSNSEAHELIGDLYMSSGDKCKSADLLQQKSIYIAAYNEYQIAGNSSRMAEAKNFFPTVEEAFSRNKKAGDSINTGCWINETVKLITK